MTSTHSILIIDADKATSRLYQREIGKVYNVIACANWAQGLEIVKTFDISAIILDPYQPDLQDWPTLDDDAVQHQEIPIIICTTADTSLASSQRVRKYLIKPVLPTQLLIELASVFTERRPHT